MVTVLSNVFFNLFWLVFATSTSRTNAYEVDSCDAGEARCALGGQHSMLQKVIAQGLVAGTLAEERSKRRGGSSKEWIGESQDQLPKLLKGTGAQKDRFRSKMEKDVTDDAEKLSKAKVVQIGAKKVSETKMAAEASSEKKVASLSKRKAEGLSKGVANSDYEDLGEAISNHQGMDESDEKSEENDEGADEEQNNSVRNDYDANKEDSNNDNEGVDLRDEGAEEDEVGNSNDNDSSDSDNGGDSNTNVDEVDGDLADENAEADELFIGNDNSDNDSNNNGNENSNVDNTEDDLSVERAEDNKKPYSTDSGDNGKKTTNKDHKKNNNNKHHKKHTNTNNEAINEFVNEVEDGLTQENEEDTDNTLAADKNNASKENDNIILERMESEEEEGRIGKSGKAERNSKQLKVKHVTKQKKGEHQNEALED